MQHFDKKMRKEWIMKYEKCGEQIPSETKEYILNLDEKKLPEWQILPWLYI